jgi:hypothetical protein
MFMGMFSALAVGFYAATTTAVQVASNDQQSAFAQTASESGMDFMRFQLAQVKIPPGTPANAIMSTLYAQLAANMNGTRNMGTDVVGLSGNVIRIPADTTHFIKLDPAGLAGFTITITAWGSDVVVKAAGHYGATASVGRAISMDFTTKFLPTTVYDFAVASQGQVVVSKGTVGGTVGVGSSIATIMSDQPIPSAVTITGGAVGGDINLVTGGAAVVTGGSVGGTSNAAVIAAQHEHIVDPAPEFPTVDTTVFAAYATNTYVSGAAIQQNIVIPAGTNPKFNSGDTVQGIMYVKSPNVVTFRGDFNLAGFIVFENAGSTAVNSLDFRGNVTQSPLPPGATFDAVRTASGVSILAPTAAVTMSGSTDSRSNGSIIVGTFNFGGAANLVMNAGTLMTLSSGPNSMVINGTKNILFSATAKFNQPSAGVSYTSYFSPKPITYQEILP